MDIVNFDFNNHASSKKSVCDMFDSLSRNKNLTEVIMKIFYLLSKHKIFKNAPGLEVLNYFRKMLSVRCFDRVLDTLMSTALGQSSTFPYDRKHK